MFLAALIACQDRSDSSKKHTASKRLFLEIDPHTYLGLNYAIKKIVFVREDGFEYPISVNDQFHELSQRGGFVLLFEGSIPTGKYAHVRLEVDLSRMQPLLIPSIGMKNEGNIGIRLLDISRKPIPEETRTLQALVSSSFVIDTYAEDDWVLYFDIARSLPPVNIDPETHELIFVPYFSIRQGVSIDEDEWMLTADIEATDSRLSPDQPFRDFVLTDQVESDIKLTNGNREFWLDINELQLVSDKGEVLSADALHVGQQVRYAPGYLMLLPSRLLALTQLENLQLDEFLVTPLLLNNRFLSGIDDIGNSRRLFSLLNKVALSETIEWSLSETGEKLNKEQVNSLSTEVDDTEMLFAFKGLIDNDKGLIVDKAEVIDATKTSYYLQLFTLSNLEASVQIRQDDALLTLDSLGKAIPTFLSIHDELVSLEVPLEKVRLSKELTFTMIEMKGGEMHVQTYENAERLVGEIDRRLSKGLYFYDLELKGIPIVTDYMADGLTITFSDKILANLPSHRVEQVKSTKSQFARTAEIIAISFGTKLGIGLSVYLIKKTIDLVRIRIRPVGHKALDGKKQWDAIREHNPAVYQAVSDVLDDVRKKKGRKSPGKFLDALSQYIEKRYPVLLKKNDPESAKSLIRDMIWVSSAGNEIAATNDQAELLTPFLALKKESDSRAFLSTFAVKGKDTLSLISEAELLNKASKKRFVVDQAALDKAKAADAEARAGSTHRPEAGIKTRIWNFIVPSFVRKRVK